MNRRQKIIVSVTGIFLVLLLLVGLTYAYFLTQITGNTNSKSISVNTANLALVYGNDDGSIIGEGETIIPGTTFETKTFTVTNNGNATTDYVVVIENVKITDIATGEPTTFESNDFTYTLTCESGCNGLDAATAFPINGGILVGNSIDVGETQNYAFTLTYEETGLNQTGDMKKTLEAKINIQDISSINPYESNKDSLAYNIINNAVLGNNGTSLVATPLTKPGEEISREDEAVLSIIDDDYGISYYFRGNVKNNYVQLNIGNEETLRNTCWRIVRIEGDGSIKITLAAQKACSNITNDDRTSAFIGNGGYGHYIIGEQFFTDYETTENSELNMKYKLNVFLNGGTFDSNDTTSFTTITKTYVSWSDEIKNKLKTKEICIANMETLYDENGNILTKDEAKIKGIWYYDTYIRLNNIKKVNLVCNENSKRTSSSKIFPLTVEEVALAGANMSKTNISFYLYNNAKSNWFTLSPILNSISGSGAVFGVNSTLNFNSTNTYQEIRPAVSLENNVNIVSGDGTINNPYILE